MKNISTSSTHVGRRANNEDALLTLPDLGLHVVSDGMGGYEGGELASQLTVESIAAFFRDNAEDRERTWPFGLNRALSIEENMADVAIRLAHRKVHARRSGPFKEMGATVAMVVLLPHQVVVAHVGDSRVYRLRDGLLEQLTIDHSLYNSLKAEGKVALGPEESFPYNNVITRAIGLTDQVQPDITTLPLEPGDRFLLCTDGLSGEVPDAFIAEVLARDDLSGAAEELVDEAFRRGGNDNITAVVVRCAP